MSQESTELCRQIVERAGQLYTLPRVAIDVLALTGDPQADVRRLSQCVQRDPALVSKLLRVVNSAMFGLSQKVSDLNQALALLGTKPLKLLVLGFSLPPQLASDVSNDQLSRFWQRALTRAVAARDLCRLLVRSQEDEAFLAGLLADLGQLVLVEQFGEPYARFLAAEVRSSAEQRSLERRTLGFDAREVTLGLLTRWSLPEALITTVRDATEIGMDEERLGAEACVGRLSQLLAETLIDVRPGAAETLCRAGERYFGLSAEELGRWARQVQEHVEQLADLFAVRLGEACDATSLVAEAHRRIAIESSDVLVELLRERAAATQSRLEAQARRDEVKALSAAATLWRHRFLTEKQPVAERAAELAKANPESPAGSNRSTPNHGGASSPIVPSRAPVATVSRERSAIREPVASGRASAGDSALAAPLRAAVALCRQQRAPLSLALVDLEGLADEFASAGSASTDALLDFIAHACAQLDSESVQCVACDDTQVAIVLPDCDRSEAVRLANRLVDELRGAAISGEAAKPLSVSVGLSTVALPPRNFPAEDLLTSARRCLSGAQFAGGNTVKSIEIY